MSEAFEGKRLVGRHRAVNAAVCEPDGSLGFHSLEIGARSSLRPASTARTRHPSDAHLAKAQHRAPAHAPLGRAPSERAHASRSARRRVSQRGALLPHARRCRKDPRRVGAGQRRASVAKVRGRRWPRHEPVRPDAEAVLPVFCFGGAWLVQCYWLVGPSTILRQDSSVKCHPMSCPQSTVRV